MFNKIKTFVTENKEVVIQNGAAVIGAIVGLVIVAIVNKVNTSEQIVDVVENMDTPEAQEPIE